MSRGWGFASVDLTVLAQACELVDHGEGDRADALLTEQWDLGTHLLNRVTARIGVLGAPDRELLSMSRHRERLVQRAIEHHSAGRYEASVPILLTQIEGITTDVSSGRLFFTRSPKRAADLIDETRLVALKGSLSALQQYYCEGVTETTASGVTTPGRAQAPCRSVPGSAGRRRLQAVPKPVHDGSYDQNVIATAVLF